MRPARGTPQRSPDLHRRRPARLLRLAVCRPRPRLGHRSPRRPQPGRVRLVGRAGRLHNPRRSTRRLRTRTFAAHGCRLEHCRRGQQVHQPRAALEAGVPPARPGPGRGSRRLPRDRGRPRWLPAWGRTHADDCGSEQVLSCSLPQSSRTCGLPVSTDAGYITKYPAAARQRGGRGRPVCGSAGLVAHGARRGGAAGPASAIGGTAGPARLSARQGRSGVKSGA
jgi:hypothetical protein